MASAASCLVRCQPFEWRPRRTGLVSPPPCRLHTHTPEHNSLPHGTHPTCPPAHPHVRHCHKAVVVVTNCHILGGSVQVATLDSGGAAGSGGIPGMAGGTVFTTLTHVDAGTVRGIQSPVILGKRLPFFYSLHSSGWWFLAVNSVHTCSHTHAHVHTHACGYTQPLSPPHSLHVPCALSLSPHSLHVPCALSLSPMRDSPPRFIFDNKVASRTDSATKSATDADVSLHRVPCTVWHASCDVCVLCAAWHVQGLLRNGVPRCSPPLALALQSPRQTSTKRRSPSVRDTHCFATPSARLTDHPMTPLLPVWFEDFPFLFDDLCVWCVCVRVRVRVCVRGAVRWGAAAWWQGLGTGLRPTLRC